jgi:RecA-family ATPase
MAAALTEDHTASAPHRTFVSEAERHAENVERHRKRFRAAMHYGRAVLDIPKPDALVDDLLDTRSLAILYGPSGSGKSFVALDIALRVASGLPWHFGKETRQGPVLYVVAEGSGDIAARVEAWLAQYAVEPDIDQVLFLTIPANLFDPEAVDALVAIVKGDAYKLVVIDTLARSMNGGDENSAKDAALVIAAADKLKDASGACVLLVHHSGYDATHARGSTAFRGACDTELEVKKSDDLVILRAAKQKSRGDGGKSFLKLEPRASSLVVVEAHGSRETVGNRSREALQALADIDDPAGMTANQWLLTVGVDANFYRTRTDLVTRQLVDNIGSGRLSRYRINDAGRTLLAAGLS